jgi:hypothetical protein
MLASECSSKVAGPAGSRGIKLKNLFTFMVLMVVSVASLPAQDPGAGGAPAMTIYPSFHLKFSNEGGNYLLASMVLMNVSGYSIRDIQLTQEFPEELVPQEAPPEIHEFLKRPEGYEESFDGQTFTMKVPLLRRRELTTAYALLKYDGRPNTAKIPPVKVSYTVVNKPISQEGPALTIELKKYSKYSGNLSAFLKRFAGIQMRWPKNSIADWGFTSFSSRVKAKTPIGMVEIEGDTKKGRFSLISGAPGETREMLFSWVPSAQGKPAGTPDEVKALIKRQTSAAADFNTDLDGSVIEETKLGRTKAWKLASTWTDRVVDRLGGGPIRWYVFTDPVKKAQFVVMLRAQGRGSGADNSGTPNEEKEHALITELEQVLSTIRLF